MMRMSNNSAPTEDRDLSASQASPSRIEFANILRGFAALSVIIFHYLAVFWTRPKVVAHLVNAPEPSPGFIVTPWPLEQFHKATLVDMGAFGVAIFFLISGFVIPFSLRKTTMAGFCVNRMFRILPTYVAGFSVTLLAIWTCSKLFGQAWPFTLSEVLVHYFPGARDMAWSRNIDGVVWTLEIEVKFYLLCALMIPLFRRGSSITLGVPFVLACACFILAGFLPALARWNPAAYRAALALALSGTYITYMFIGVVFHWLHQGRLPADKAYLLAGSLFGVFCVQWYTGPFHANFGGAWNFAWGLLAFAFAFSFQRFFRANGVFDFFANISYPLYVVHGVAGYAALRILLEYRMNPWMALGVVGVGAIGVAWLIHVLIEKPSQALGKAWARRIDDYFGAGKAPPSDSKVAAKAA